MSSSFVAILMGSDSDLPVMEACFGVLRDFDISFEAKITSAHRTPEITKEYVQDADCLLYTSPSPRDRSVSRMPSSA